MITRIVKMEVDPERGQVFRKLFDGACQGIRAFPGCLGLELLHDVTRPGVFFTISRWQEASDLEAYRNSALFNSTWNAVKPLFVAKPMAWSLSVEKDLNRGDSNNAIVS